MRGGIGLADARAARHELGVGIGADQALALHYAADAAPAEHDAPAGEGRLDLPGPVPSAALLERRRHLLGGGIGRLGRLRPAAHGAAGRSGRAEDLALRRYRVAAGVRRNHRQFRANISAACFKTSFSMRRRLLSLSRSAMRCCSGVLLTAALGDPVALMELIHRRTVERSRS